MGEVEEDDYAFLGEIGSGSNGGFWSMDLWLNNSTVRFKIDTGADVTIIPERIYRELQPTPALSSSSKTLKGFCHGYLAYL